MNIEDKLKEISGRLDSYHIEVKNILAKADRAVDPTVKAVQRSHWTAALLLLAGGFLVYVGFLVGRI